MMNGASRKSKKRSHSPAESNNSFVKNITSTVSNLIPSSIKRWFSPTSTSKTNSSTQTADPTDSSSEDEILETSVVVQPPPKRKRYNSSKINHLGQSEVNYSTDSVDAIEQYDIIQPTSSRNHFKSAPNYVSTPIHTITNEPSNDKRERETTVIKSHSYSTKGPSLSKNRKSLFEDFGKDSNKQAKKETIIKETSGSNDYSEPYFKPGLLSPFYRGKTTYGGAASSYMNQSNVISSKISRVNETSKNDNTLSHSTRRVMELLENYSSPRLEAKRISPYVTSQNSCIKSLENSSHSCEKCHSLKTQELHEPSIASLLSIKQKLRIMNTTKAARQIMASQSSAINYSPYPISKPQSDLSNKTTEKLKTNVKNRVISTKRNETTVSIHDLPSPTKFPNAVLQIDQNNMPKLNFGTPVVSTSCSLSNQTAPIPKNTLTAAPEIKIATKDLSNDIHSSELEPSSDNNSYKFATQVVVSRDKLLTSEVPKFTFEYPKWNVDEIDSNKEKKETTPVLIVANNTNTMTERPKDWKCSDCWVVNKADASNCVCCSAKKPKEQKKALNTCPVFQSEVTEGSGQDKCSECKETPKSNDSTSLPITSLQAKTWRCGDCWVDNVETSEKCICCGFKNPKTSETIELPSTNAFENDWKCSNCWIKNQSNVDKCIACGAVKPNSSLNSKPTISLTPIENITSSSFKARDNKFDNILKAQTNKWECSNCLVRNDIDKTKCVCCETEKTGVIKEAKTTSFNFGMNTNTSFKFGIDPKVQVDNCNKDLESEECIEQSAANEKLETNNNVLAKTPTFTFRLPANTIDDKNKETLATPVSKAIEVPKLNFTFGIPKQTPNTTESVNLNSNREELATISEEKLQQVQTIVISKVQSQNAATEQKNIFESNLGSHESLLKIPSSNTSEVTGTATEENNITFNPLIPETASNIETNKANTFTQTGLKISTNVFNITSSTIANASTSTNFTALSVPVTASSSLFQKSYLDTKPTETLFQTTGSAQSDTNLFQNPKTTTEITAPTFSTSTKLFSFGNNTQNSLLESGHSKFNFSFGNTNKADIPPMFNATFGMNKDSNTSSNSNKFYLSTSNNVGTNSALPASSLESGNLLTTGNPVMCNTLSGNNGITTGNPLCISDLGNNSLNAGNNLKSANPLSTIPSNGIFGGIGQKENVWSNSNNVPGNLFDSNAATNSLQRPATFTFGSSIPFNASNIGTAFGNNTSNVFTMHNPSSNLFFNTPQSQTVPTIFGNSQTTSSPAPNMGVFGSTNPPTNSFNVHNPTIPTFETQSQNPMTAPSFNFGAQQQLGTVPFGFGQQQPQQQQPQQPQQPQQFQSPVYKFGANQSTPQFNMGSAPNQTVRRVRKAVRRSTQR